jgi:hypothetical protein
MCRSLMKVIDGIVVSLAVGVRPVERDDVTG